MGKQWKQWLTLFFWAPKSLWMVIAAMKLKGKLELVKQGIAKVNIDILGISELKWTGMGEFNSNDHYIYYCEQESLRRNGTPS